MIEMFSVAPHVYISILVKLIRMIYKFSRDNTGI